MKYKILEREDYHEALGFHFYVDKCEDTSGNVIYCLVACNKREYCLFKNSDFITFTQVNEEIKDFLMRKIKAKIAKKLLSLKLNMRYSFEKHSDYFHIIDHHSNNSYFAHLNDFEGNYDLLAENIINYLEGLALNTK